MLFLEFNRGDREAVRPAAGCCQGVKRLHRRRGGRHDSGSSTVAGRGDVQGYGESWSRHYNSRLDGYGYLLLRSTHISTEVDLIK